MSYEMPPPIALAAGCNVRTLGPHVRLKDNWHEWDFLGAKPKCGQAIQNLDGTVTLPGGDGSGYGANISTANKAGGLFLGGKSYIDFLIRFKPTLGPATLPFPALWALTKSFVTGHPSTQWKDQPPNFSDRIETDYFQWPRDTTLYWQGPGVINWFGFGSTNNDRLRNVKILDENGSMSCDPANELHDGNYVTLIGKWDGTGSIEGYAEQTAYKISAHSGTDHFTLVNLDGRTLETSPGTAGSVFFSYCNVTMPTQKQGFGIKMPFSFEDFNHFSFLTTPATPTSRGSILSFLNGVQVKFAAGGADPSWDMYDENLPPPPKFGTSAGSLIDVSQNVLIIGTGPDMPMDVGAVSAWQPSTALNATTP